MKGEFYPWDSEYERDCANASATYDEIDLANSFVGLGFAIKRLVGSWSFRAIEPDAYPYRPHIQVSAPEREIPQEIVEKLNKLALWSGNTSNSPEEYSHWEFPSDGVHWYAAVNLLKGNGWSKN